MSRAFTPTLKEVPADAQVVSHVFMIRGGFIRRVAAGVYNFLPLGWRVINKIERIIREELDKAGAQEVLMPAAVPAELWQETGRWQKYGPELLRFKDRKGADFCFGPTHEEVIVDMVRREVKSYRDLPLNLYQIQGKFRDELRPRAGLMRGREFIMKDAYSFDVDLESARKSYQAMYDAYGHIFSRCGLSFRVVEADTGAIGGDMSHEFQVLASSGEDTLVACDGCDYAANVEQAEMAAPAADEAPADGPALESVATPGKKTIDEVADFLEVPASRLVKTLIYVAGGKAIAVCVRGDRTVNEVRLKKVVGADELFAAGDKQVTEATGAPVGFAGPVGLEIPVYADVELQGLRGAYCGGNAADVHLGNLDMARDVPSATFDTLRAAGAGDRCARCDDGAFMVERGIEVGHVFLLERVYTEPMKATVLGEDGKQAVMEMGCYGIGVTRVAAAAIEQNHDEGGILWPLSIAPYEVHLLALQPKDQGVMDACERLYKELGDAGLEVLFDDRKERPGAKFADADLIGIPLRIAVGKRTLGEGEVEFKWRADAEASRVPVEDIVGKVAELARTEKERLRRLGA